MKLPGSSPNEDNVVTDATSSPVAAVDPLLSHGPPLDLFPLPLTPFEKLMLDDERPGYPRTFTVIVEFTGTLQRLPFEQAMREVVRRNPLLCAVVRKLQSKWNWVSTPFPAKQIAWESAESTEAAGLIDLRKMPGFRASGHTDGDKSELRLVFHHAVSDGQGARRIILDWLTLYAAIVRPDAKLAALDRLDYERLRRRGEFLRANAPKKLSSVPAPPTSFWQRCKLIFNFGSQIPTPLRSAVRVGRTARGGPPHSTVCRFDRRDLDRFRDKVRGTRMTLNDVAIGLLLNSIARWNRQNGETGRDRLYRILVPVDLRESGDLTLPATNRLSFVFIARPTSLCLDWPRLLETIRAEMDYIDDNGSKYDMVKTLPILQGIPGVIPIGVRVPACFSTAILTNLGDPARSLRHRFPEDDDGPIVGNLRFVRARAAPPLRPKTRLGIGMTISLGELVIQSHFDSNIFSSADSAAFSQLFADAWHRWSSSDAEFGN